MEHIVLGAIGVLVVLGLLVLGFSIGWRCRIMWTRHTTRAVKQELTEQERRDLIAQQRAFDSLMNYSAETAYGMTAGLQDLAGEAGDD